MTRPFNVFRSRCLQNDVMERGTCGDTPDLRTAVHQQYAANHLTESLPNSFLRCFRLFGAGLFPSIQPDYICLNQLVWNNGR